MHYRRLARNPQGLAGQASISNANNGQFSIALLFAASTRK